MTRATHSHTLTATERSFGAAVPPARMGRVPG
jgi:hypothetical protein